MRVVENDHLIHFDVDNTLVKWEESPFTYKNGRTAFDFPGSENKVYLVPHEKHILLLKTHAARGYHVTVWSANGYKWAEEVVRKLNLVKYVDDVRTKPLKIVDDLPIEDIFPEPLYIEDRLYIEEWKDIKGFEDYAISNLARVYSKKSKTYRKITKGNGGYSSVTLTKGKKSKTMYLHRLVAEAFCQKLDDQHNQVDHIDGNKDNNCSRNLRWVTDSENKKYSYQRGKRYVPRGSEKSKKLTEQDAIEIYKRAKSGKETLVNIAKDYNIHPVTVGNIRDKKKWKHIHK